MAKYRLKVLIDIDIPVADDPTAREIAKSYLRLLDSRILYKATLISEGSKDGRNILMPNNETSSTADKR